MRSFDAIIIGAGVIGTSIGYHLSLRGMRVALVDRNDIASGTSCRCDAYAMLTDKQPGFDTALGYQSIRALKELSEKFDYDFDFHQKGSLWVCESEEELEVARQYIDKQQADGYRVAMVDQKELHEREPYLAEDLPGGYWSAECSGMNPYKLCFAFAAEGEKLGLRIFTYENVTAVLRDQKGAISGVETDKQVLHAPIVINCCGVWAPEIGKMVGIELPIVPRKGVILLSESTFPVVKQKVQEFGYMASKFGDLTYERRLPKAVEENNVSLTIEQMESQNLLIGSSRNFAGLDISSEIEVINALAMRAIRFLPILKEINCLRSYAGVRPFIPDHFPIVSAVAEVPGFYVAAGHEGEGISLSAITGRLMTSLVFGEEPEIDIHNLRYDRFQACPAESL